MQHGEIVVALANAQGDGFTQVPFLLIGALEGPFFPVGRGQQAAHFALNVDASELTEAQPLELRMHHVHRKVVGQNVVIGVAGLNDGAVHVDAAMAALLVIPKAMATKHEIPWVDDGLLWRACTHLQRDQRHERLVRGARRVGAAQRAVQQGLVGRFIQRLPVLGVNALHKQVGVKRGLADKGQHLSGFRLNRHQRAAPIAKQIFHHLLQLDVDRQLDGVARCGRAAGQLAHRPPARRGLDRINARGAMQGGFKALLDAQLADVFGALVIGLVFVRPVVHGFFLGLVHTADIANHVAGRFTKRVVAKQPCLDVHAGEAVALDGEFCDFFICQTRADRQGFKVA